MGFQRWKKGSSTETLVTRSTGRWLRSAARRIASSSGPSYTQNVRPSSQVTYECSQFTPSSAFRSTTRRQASAPASVAGMARPWANVRSTMYLGMWLPSSRPRCRADEENLRTLDAPRIGDECLTPTTAVPNFASGLLAGGHVELGQDRRDVVVDGPLGQEQPV